MHAEHDDTMKTSDTVLRKIYLLLYLKGCVWETEQNCNIMTLTLLAITAFLSCFPGMINRRPRRPLCCILSPTGLVSKLTDFLSSPSYIIVQRSLLLVGVTIALIQPIHGQGYNSDIPRPDCTCYLHRCISYYDSPGRVVSQYTTYICREVRLIKWLSWIWH